MVTDDRIDWSGTDRPDKTRPHQVRLVWNGPGVSDCTGLKQFRPDKIGEDWTGPNQTKLGQNQANNNINSLKSHLQLSTLSASPDGSNKRRAEEALNREAVKAGVH